MNDPVLNALDSLIPYDTEEAKKTRTVVRLRRSFWHDNDGAYQRVSLRYLKRHAEGFNLFDDDCGMVGADNVISKITNLSECEDGIYEIVTCNAHRDWETGHIEDWDYRLIPFNNSK